MLETTRVYMGTEGVKMTRETRGRQWRAWQTATRPRVQRAAPANLAQLGIGFKVKDGKNG